MTPLAETAARPPHPAAPAALAATMPPRTGLCLAMVHGQAHTFLTHGRTGRTTGEPVNPDTAFEVGSITKTFTALLFAEMAARGELAYSDPIDAHLPAGHRPAVLHGGPVTLLHLATHTSGLPRLPPGMLLNALPAWSTNPYGGYSGEHLLRALARTRIRARPGSRVRYSNYGVGVLGRLLADTAGMGYPQLLNQRVCAPLGLPGTRCAPDPLTQATGHRRGGHCRRGASPGCLGPARSAQQAATWHASWQRI